MKTLTLIITFVFAVFINPMFIGDNISKGNVEKKNTSVENDEIFQIKDLSNISFHEVQSGFILFEEDVFSSYSVFPMASKYFHENEGIYTGGLENNESGIYFLSFSPVLHSSTEVSYLFNHNYLLTFK